MKKTNEKDVRRPLFHIVKRGEVTLKTAVLVRVAAILAAMVVASLVIVIMVKKNPFEVYAAMLAGSFGTVNLTWTTLHQLAILLCVSLAVTPAFKMKYWNIGAEGQVLVGGLATAASMFYLGGKVPNALLYLIMAVAGILGGVIWAVIPALFKAKWNTNETLFTLMMNYIAIQLVSLMLDCWDPGGRAYLAPMDAYGFPKIGPHAYFLNIAVVAVLTVLVYIYLRYSKQGYEISVVGESVNTAKYIGINVKKVIIRTVAISGALCGVAGLLLVGGNTHTITTDLAGGRGFTAIMVSWLAKFNPAVMVATSFLVVLLERGASKLNLTYRIPTEISDILTAIFLFFIIGCEFFINYRVVFNKRGREV